MTKITKRQREVLMAIHSFIIIQGVSPTLKELGTILGVTSDQTIIEMLERLEKGGWINRDRKQARSVILTTEAKNALGLVFTTTSADSPFVLDEQKSRMYDQLIKIDPKLGQMYRGAIAVLSAKWNEDRIAQSALSMREVIAKLSLKGSETIPPDVKKRIESERNTGAVVTGLSYFFDPRGAEGISVNPYVTLYDNYQTKLNDIAHHNVQPDEVEYQTLLKEVEYFLLRYIFPRQVDVYRIIDETLSKGPMGVDPEDLRLLITRNVETFRYFFKQASAEWVVFLKQHAFLEPRVEVGEYLAQIAQEAPRNVLDIFNVTTFRPDDWNVARAYIEALTKLPVEYAAKAIDKVLASDWVTIPTQHVLYYRLQDLFEVLIRGKAYAEALRLADKLFDVYPQKYGSESYSSVRTGSYLSAYEYGESMKLLHEVDAKELVPFLRVINEKLYKTIREVHVRTDGGTEDYSHIWRTTISDSGQNRHHDQVEDELISGLRDLVVKRIESLIVSGDEQKAKREFDSIFSLPIEYTIFKRLRIYFYSKFPELFLVEAKEIAFHPTLESDTWHEYCAVLKNILPLFTLIEREAFFAMLDTPHETDKYSDSMKLRILAIIGDQLNEDEKARYAESLESASTVKNPDLLSYMESSYGYIGDNSPKNEAEMEVMSTPDLIKLLKTWEGNPDDFMGPSIEGLGYVFRGVVSKNGERFFSEASLFKDLELKPAFLYDYFIGLTESMKSGTNADWSDVLDLMCELASRVSKMTSPETLKKKRGQPETGWGSVMQEMARALVRALDSNMIQFQDNERAWTIISCVVEHSDPTPEHEKEYGGENMDPYTLSVNTVRGEGFHALIAYMFWYNRCKGSEAKEWQPLIPEEVKGVLQEHLDITHDPSFAIRSVYGRFFPWIHKYDSEWTRSVLGDLFPSDNKELFYAAWETYLSNPVFEESYIFLRPQYEQALKDLKYGGAPKRRYWADTLERLAAHVVVAYVFDLDTKTDPFYELFFKEAGGKAKGMAVSFGGRSFINRDIPREDQAPDVERLKKFWSWRVTESTSPTELAQFGWWTKRGKFDDEWLLEHLLLTLQKSKGDIDAEFIVMETIDRLASVYPLLCSKVLYEIYTSPKTAERYAFMRMGELRSSLSTICSSDDAEAKEIAYKLIDYLLKVGFSDLRTIKQE